MLTWTSWFFFLLERLTANWSTVPVLPLARSAPPPRRHTSCAVRRPGRGLSTVCPLCVQSTSVVSHCHNCIPKQKEKERKEREVAGQSFFSPSYIRRIPSWLFGVFFPDATWSPSISTESDTRSGNIFSLSNKKNKIKIWTQAFLFPVSLKPKLHLFRIFRFVFFIYISTLLPALCHSERLLLSLLHRVCY